jgi:serine/threonine protein kinase
MSESPPSQIPGYELLRELGAGGMATVYLANQTSLDRKVAIKVLRVTSRDVGTEGERTEKRFLREGRMLARLSHKNVCGIYDIAKVGNLAYIAMEFIEGGTLGDRLRRGMTAGEAISAVVQLAGALAAAHAIGIVHRDLKPANVMMRGKVPVLTDFGIARDLSSDRTEITGDNILGTPNYMSPEQISGKPIDGRSDIYSLGAMLFELLTGRQPYQGDSPIAVCMQHLQAPIPELPAQFADLQPIIDGMMAKDRDDRFADMASVVVALRAVLLDSETLRTALKFDTDLPWSEQLRELGFSFDGPGAETLREAMKRSAEGQSVLPKSATLRGKPVQPVPAPAPPAPAPPPARFGMRERAIAAIVVLLLVVAGVWWGLAEEKLSPEQESLLAIAGATFDQQLAEEQLVSPENDNALNSLRGLYAVSREHPQVLQRQQALRSKIEQKVDNLARSTQFGEARGMLSTAAILFDAADLEQRLARIDQAQQDQTRDADIAARVADIETILGAPGGVQDARLAPALVELQALAGKADARYQALIERIATTLSSAIQQAVDQRQLATAAATRDRMRELLPESEATRAADLAVQRLSALAAGEATQADLVALLQDTARLTPASIDQVLAGLPALDAAGLDEPAARLRERLQARTEAEARRALVAGDLPLARALLAPVAARFPEVAALRTLDQELLDAETALVEKRRAEEEAQREGQLALDAAPWGRVMSVVAADGSERQLGDDRTTPLLLTLPEGRYKVTLQGPDGRTQQQADAVVTRGQLSVAELSFAALDADTYLKQAGYR